MSETLKRYKELADSYFTKCKLGEPLEAKLSDYYDAMNAIDDLLKRLEIAEKSLQKNHDYYMFLASIWEGGSRIVENDRADLMCEVAANSILVALEEIRK